MNVKCIKNYHDRELGTVVYAGQVINVTTDRADTLVKAGVAEVLPTPTPEVAAKKPKRAKKEA